MVARYEYTQYHGERNNCTQSGNYHRRIKVNARFETT